MCAFRATTFSPRPIFLVERNLPFIFATALMPHDTSERHRDRPLLKKPFRREQVYEMLAAVLLGRTVILRSECRAVGQPD